MTPETLVAVRAVATIVSTLGTLPIGTLIVLAVMGPWFAAIVLVLVQGRRFDAVVQMYKDNVALVEEAQAQNHRFEKLAKDQHGTIVYNTEIMTEVRDKADNNLFCPWNRRGINPRDIES